MKMGCSSSLDLQSFHKKPLHNGLLSSQNGISNKSTIDHQHSKDNIHVNSTEIVIFATDSHDSKKNNENNNIITTDSSSVVPFFNNERQNHSGFNHMDSCLNTYSDNGTSSIHKDSHNNNVHHNVKSVLKTNRNDIPNHMMSSRPIKSVTFVDSVTVVTVY
ncbi:hypothetical protein ACF0H5_000630 [Mactra antiquata]